MHEMHVRCTGSLYNESLKWLPNVCFFSPFFFLQDYILSPHSDSVSYALRIELSSVMKLHIHTADPCKVWVGQSRGIGQICVYIMLREFHIHAASRQHTWSICTMMENSIRNSPQVIVKVISNRKISDSKCEKPCTCIFNTNFISGAGVHLWMVSSQQAAEREKLKAMQCH